MRKSRENGMGNLFHKFAGASGRDRMKLCYAPQEVAHHRIKLAATKAI
jgi:hypothetical protein